MRLPVLPGTSANRRRIGARDRSRASRFFLLIEKAGRASKRISSHLWNVYNVTAHIISVENPTARKGINPGCTDYRHSKFVRRRQYVETVLLPQMADLMPTEIFRAVTDEHFTVDNGIASLWRRTMEGPLCDVRLKIGSGNTGNFLSHLSLWRQATTPLLILEDDASLPVENTATVMDALAQFSEVKEPAVLHLLSAMPWKEHGTKDFADVTATGGLLRVNRTGDLSGTAAYAVNAAGAAVLVLAAMRDGTLPTDGFIHRAFERGEIAVMVPERHRECFMLDQHFAAWQHIHEGIEA